jgi:hypothetical protein
MVRRISLSLSLSPANVLKSRPKMLTLVRDCQRGREFLLVTRCMAQSVKVESRFHRSLFNPAVVVEALCYKPEDRGFETQ